jgi:hypothetical protein
VDKVRRAGKLLTSGTTNSVAVNVMTNHAIAPSDSNDLIAALDVDTEKNFREDFIEDTATGRICFTTKGFAEYGSLFAKVAIDIN